MVGGRAAFAKEAFQLRVVDLLRIDGALDLANEVEPRVGHSLREQHVEADHFGPVP